MEKKKISITVIRRLPKYYRKLEDLEKIKISRVSSQELSVLTGFTASQIRQDLNNFGGFGQQGYGYNVKELKDNLEKILGLKNVHNTCVVGAGNLGSAVANFKGFDDAGFKIVAIFDKSEDVIGTKIGGISVKDSADMKKTIKDKDIKIAVLTVPKENAQDVAEELVEANVKSIWNLTTADLDLKDDVIVEDVSLIDSLFTLSYFMKEKYK
ncbi:MAG: redox-sensing transcriptional repressor Rex [Tissierellia bacterium]|nr:redox-sensing transcriptional repressor Rex [Tissierellia bacterium]